MLSIRSLPSAAQARPATAHRSRATSMRVHAGGWTKIGSKTALSGAGGKTVVETAVGRILLAEVEGTVFAVSNKCSHLGLPLIGKTALLQGEVKDKCIICPAHGTYFDLATGEVQGEWCPKLPNLPIVGKGPAQKPLPTYECRVSGDDIEVLL
eukprot:jgi/Tetstr1/461381/TSEL_000592.t1